MKILRDKIKLKFILFALFLSCIFVAITIGEAKTEILTKGLDQVQEIERLANLNAQAIALKEKDHKRALEIAEDGLEISKKIGDTFSEAEFNYTIAEIYILTGELALAIRHLKAAKNIYQMLDKINELTKCWGQLGMSYMGQRDFEQALQYFNKALAVYRSLEDMERIAIVKNRIGGSYFMQTKYNQALVYFDEVIKMSEEYCFMDIWAAASSNKAAILKLRGKTVEALDINFGVLAIFKELDKLLSLAITNHQIGHILQKHQLYDDALFFYSEAQSYYSNLGAEGHLSSLYLNLGEIAFEEKKYEDAIDYFDRSIKKDQRVKQKLSSEAFFYKAKLYKEKGEYDLAIALADEIFLLREQEDNHRAMGGLCNFKGGCYLEMTQLDKAEENLHLALEIADSIHVIEDLKAVYINLTALNQQKQNYQQALWYQNKVQQMNDSLYNVEKIMEINKRLIQEKLIEQKKETASWKSVALDAKSAVVSLENNRTQIRKKHVFNLVGFTLCLLLLIKWIYADKKKQEHIKLKLEENQNIQKDLQRQLDHRNQEINKLSIDLVRKNQALKELKGSLEKLAKDKPTQKELNDLLRRIQLNEMLQDDWNYFQELFDKIFPDFFARLQKKYMNLSKSDLRLCGLIRSKVSPQETADILGISLESVHSARYRLRKKMALERKTDLNLFISAI